MFEEQIVRESKRIDDLSSRLRRMEAQQIGRDITHAPSPPANPRPNDIWADTTTQEMYIYSASGSLGFRTTLGWCSVIRRDAAFVPVSVFQSGFSSSAFFVRAAWKKGAERFAIQTFSFVFGVDPLGGGTSWDVNNKWRVDCYSLYSTNPAGQNIAAVDLQAAYPGAPGGSFGYTHSGSFWTFEFGWGAYLDFVKIGNPPNFSFQGGSLEYRRII